jgi:hypothetical protein
MEKHHYKLLILVFAIIAGALVFFVKFLKVPQKPDSTAFEPTPAPMPVVEAQEPIVTSVGSPDGKLTLTMREENSTEGPVYNFFTTDLEGSKNLIFTKTASAGAVLSIPANTFSPDNKYVFLKEEYGGVANYFLPVPSGIIDISAMFTAKYPDFVVTDMTGWGGINLIVINTDKAGGGIGPSFWFDVPTRSFYRLATRFN